MKLTEIMRAEVVCTERFGFESVDGQVGIKQIVFEGTVSGSAFNGKILPSGVDTQTIHGEDKVLSARYLFDGVDCEGNPCQIYVENNCANFIDEKGRYFMGHPKMATNSKALSYLNKELCVTEGISRPGIGPIIIFYHMERD